jgi:hypothetical protein
MTGGPVCTIAPPRARGHHRAVPGAASDATGKSTNQRVQTNPGWIRRDMEPSSSETTTYKAHDSTYH